MKTLEFINECKEIFGFPHKKRHEPCELLMKVNGLIHAYLDQTLELLQKPRISDPQLIHTFSTVVQVLDFMCLLSFTAPFQSTTNTSKSSSMSDLSFDDDKDEADACVLGDEKLSWLILEIGLVYLENLTCSRHKDASLIHLMTDSLETSSNQRTSTQNSVFIILCSVGIKYLDVCCRLACCQSIKDDQEILGRLHVCFYFHLFNS